jgi:hypothetical protein
VGKEHGKKKIKYIHVIGVENKRQIIIAISIIAYASSLAL